MLLTSSATLPSGPGWLYEIKWDGFRAIATIAKDQFELRSRHGTDMRPWFPSLDALPAHLGRDVVLDGEVVVLDEHGRPDFYAIRSGVPTFVAFDVLRLDGRDVAELALRDRHALLEQIVIDALPLIIRSRPFTDGAALLAMAEDLQIEGVVAKRAADPYRQGDRSRGWVKVKSSYGRAEALRRLELAQFTRERRSACAPIASGSRRAFVFREIYSTIAGRARMVAIQPEEISSASSSISQPRETSARS